MTPPAVLLCLQLVIVTTGSSWALPASATATVTGTTSKVDHSRLEALFPGGTSHSATSSSVKGSPAVVSRSKRQPWMPTLIDSGDDSFAYRQHHQPPPPLEPHYRQHSGLHQHPHRFRQPPPPPPPEDFGVEDYDQDQNHSSEMDSNDEDNEIGDNPFYTAAAAAIGPESPGSPGNPVAGHAPGTPVESIDLIREQLERVKEEEDIEIKSELLMKLLEQLPEGPLPIVYIEDAGGSEAATMVTENGAGGEPSGDDPVGQVERFTANGDKRSGRYYRRYPWKRQNARARTYDADARYLCVPSREDVFKLLVGLHENRIGNHQKTINFCNRKRPAKAIFTNIRFLG